MHNNKGLFKSNKLACATRDKDDTTGACVLQAQRVPPVRELACPSGAACINTRLDADRWVLPRHVRMRRRARVDRPTHANLGEPQSVLVGRLLLIQTTNPFGEGQGPRCRPVRRGPFKAREWLGAVSDSTSSLCSMYSCKSRLSGRSERKALRRLRFTASSQCNCPRA